MLRVVPSEDEGLTRRRADQAQQYAQGCGLTGPVRAEESGDSSCLETERQVVDRSERAETLRQVVDLYDTGRCRHAPSSPRLSERRSMRGRRSGRLPSPLWTGHIVRHEGSRRIGARTESTPRTTTDRR
jgi:hypothetical protein